MPQITEVCTFCKKWFEAGDTIKNHIELRHLNITGELKFSCDQCKYFFKTETELRSHKRNIHTGEKTFKCDKCDKAFKQSAHLIQHKNRAHEGIKYK